MTYATVQDGPMQVGATSPLSLASLRNTAVPAGSKGRIVASTIDAEKLVEARNPTVPVRFHVASWALNSNDVPVPTDHAAIDAGVKHLAAMGYNAIRIFGPEHFLMDGTTGEYNFPAGRLDQLDYVMYRCKQEGLYWILCPKADELYQDGAGAGRYAMPGSAKKLKGRLFTQKETRDHWLAGFTALWDRINPYTGVNMLDDPALALVEPMNENNALVWVNSKSLWPTEWSARDGGTTQGTAGLLYQDWLATIYANVAALNTAWGTAHASFTAAATARTAHLKAPAATQQDLDAILYTVYLDENMWDYYNTALNSLGYVGLRSPAIVFPLGHAIRLVGRKKASNTVLNSHTYVNTNELPPGDGNTLTTNNLPVTGAWEYGYAMNVAAAYGGSPRWQGEYGWVSVRYRYMYPMMHAYAAMHGVSALTHFHQGDPFAPTYQESNQQRSRLLYGYHGNVDPVVRFGQTVGFFALQKGYCSEGAVNTSYAISDNDLGISPVTLARIARFSQDFLSPLSRVAALGKTTFGWTSDTGQNNLTPVWYAKSEVDLCADLLASGAITADNETRMFALANSGSISAIDLTDPIKPIITVASHTLINGCKIAIPSLTGSGANWPGTNLKNGQCEIDVIDATHLQITSSTIALNAATWTGTLVAGTWTELGNHLQSGNKELRMSRRYKYVSIDTTKLKFLGVMEGATIPAISGFTVSSIVGECGVFAASLDGLALSSATSILVGLCGNAQNSGDVLSNDLKTTTKAGGYPIQIDQCAATFRLTVADAILWRIRALDVDGTADTLQSVTVIDTTTIEVSISTCSNPVIYWELTKGLRNNGLVGIQ